MQRKVFIDNYPGNFRAALIDRLTRSGANFCDEPGKADISIGIGNESSGDIVILPKKANPGNSNLVIRISDLVIPWGGDGWGTEILNKWLENIKKGKTEFNNEELDFRHWVHINDVVEALTILIIEDSLIHDIEEIEICGRRTWSDLDVFDELQMLWSRYQNSVNHSHTVESLSSIPSPVRRGLVDDSNRPDLSLIHNILISTGREGWHPKTPMRTTLMELIAFSESITSDPYLSEL